MTHKHHGIQQKSWTHTSPNKPPPGLLLPTKTLKKSMMTSSTSVSRTPRRSRATTAAGSGSGSGVRKTLTMEEKVKAWLVEAQEYVDKYKLSEAEQCFWQVLEWSSEDMQHNDKQIITALTGLAEVYHKRGRSMRDNELEWHRMYLYAVTAQKRALEQCQSALHWRHDNAVETWLLEQQSKCASQLKSLEDCLINSLASRLALNHEGAHVDVSWLDEFQDFCKDKISRQIERYNSKENLYLLCQPEGEDKASSQQVNTEVTKTVVTAEQESPKKKKKINFHRVQEVIQNIVKQISSDLREREVHMHFQKGGYKSRYQCDMQQPGQRPSSYRAVYNKWSTTGNYHLRTYHTQVQSFQQHKIAEELEMNQIYQRHVLSKDASPSVTRPILTHGERISLMSPLTENKNLLDELEHALNDELATTAEGGDHVAGVLVEDEPAVVKMSNEVAQEKATLDTVSPEKQQKRLEALLNQRRWNGDNGDGHKVAINSATQETFCLARPTPPVRAASGKQFELRGNVIRGVLTVWKAYDTDDDNCDRDCDVRDTVQPDYECYDGSFFEEKSALTKILCIEPETLARSQGLVFNNGQLADKLPVTERTLKATTVQVLTKLGDAQMSQKHYTQAYSVYKYALQLLNSLILKQEPIVVQITHILHNMGLIKCYTGDVEAGMCLMERCVQIYKKSSEADKEYKIAALWLDMGNLYMEQQWEDTSLFVQIMRIVRDEIEYDERRETMSISDDSDDESDDGQDYWVSTQEAVSCYHMALKILRELQEPYKTSSGNGNALPQKLANLLVDVLSKLGDCSISAGDYDKGVCYFEEVLGLFKNMLGSAALPANAHVLSMLGTANFLLRNFPKAVAMYECAHILQQHLYGSEKVGGETLFILTMLGISFYSMKHHHKCIAWCLKAYELHSSVFDTAMESLDDLHKWFVTETLYSLGYSYSTLEFHEKAIRYLLLACKIIRSETEAFDVKQLVKILKAVADVHTSRGEDTEALSYYEEALSYSASLGDEESATALKNQLLNRMAGVHVHNKQYRDAANYLEQALGYQKNVQNSIKDDMIGLQKQLATTYALSGDIDRALECYADCVEDFEDLEDPDAIEFAQILGSQATLYHVKACIEDDNEEMLTLLHIADTQYKKAVCYNDDSATAIRYANYLYQQELYGDALLVLLPHVHCEAARGSCSDLVLLQYNGLEQAVLPEHLQQEIEESDEVDLDTRIFGRFLAILCYKQLHLISDADDCLIDAMKLLCAPSPTGVSTLTIVLDLVMLAFSFLELQMYDEAACTFFKASSLEPNNHIPYTNALICVVLWIYQSFARVIYHMLAFDRQKKKTERKLRRRRPRKLTKASSNASAGKRDSGYDDTFLASTEHIDSAHLLLEEQVKLAAKLPSSARRSRSYTSNLSNVTLQDTSARHVGTSDVTVLSKTSKSTENLQAHRRRFSSTGISRETLVEAAEPSLDSNGNSLFQGDIDGTNHSESPSTLIYEARKRQQALRSPGSASFGITSGHQPLLSQEDEAFEEESPMQLLDRLSKELHSVDEESREIHTTNIQVECSASADQEIASEASPGSKERKQSIMDALAEAKSMMDDIQLMSSTMSKLDEVEAMSNAIEEPVEQGQSGESTLDILQALADDIDKDLESLSARHQHIERSHAETARSPHDVLNTLKRKYGSEAASSSVKDKVRFFSQNESPESMARGSVEREKTSMLDTVRRRYSYHYGNTSGTGQDDSDDTQSSSEAYDNVNGNSNKPYSSNDVVNDNVGWYSATRDSYTPKRWSAGMDYRESSPSFAHASYSSRLQATETSDDHIYDNLSNYRRNDAYDGRVSSQTSSRSTNVEEPFESWETEETVDTPPELLAILRAQAVKH